MELPNGKVIKSLKEGESYKYLATDKSVEEKMYLNVSKEYIRRLRKLLKSKPNGGSLVLGVNTWALSLLRYSVAFVSWRKSELHARIEKLGSCQDRLYIPRKEGGRGLIPLRIVLK